MEKHKPYRCEVCGKRYKNLNGLKYHKNHSPACDTEAKPSEEQEQPSMMDMTNQNSGIQQGIKLNFPVGGGGVTGENIMR